MGIFPNADELMEYMGVTDEDREKSMQRAQRREAAKGNSTLGRALGQTAGAAQEAVSRDVNAKFMQARREEGDRNREEEEVETVTTIKNRKIRSRHHNYDASSQWDDQPGFG